MTWIRRTHTQKKCLQGTGGHNRQISRSATPRNLSAFRSSRSKTPLSSARVQAKGVDFTIQGIKVRDIHLELFEEALGFFTESTLRELQRGGGRNDFSSRPIPGLQIFTDHESLADSLYWLKGVAVKKRNPMAHYLVGSGKVSFRENIFNEDGFNNLDDPDWRDEVVLTIVHEFIHAILDFRLGGLLGGPDKSFKPLSKNREVKKAKSVWHLNLNQHLETHAGGGFSLEKFPSRFHPFRGFAIDEFCVDIEPAVPSVEPFKNLNYLFDEILADYGSRYLLNPKHIEESQFGVQGSTTFRTELHIRYPEMGRFIADFVDWVQEPKTGRSLLGLIHRNFAH